MLEIDSSEISHRPVHRHLTAPYFRDCLSAQDLDELNIEIIRNTVSISLSFPHALETDLSLTCSCTKATSKTSTRLFNQSVPQLPMSCLPFSPSKPIEDPSTSRSIPSAPPSRKNNEQTCSLLSVDSTLKELSLLDEQTILIKSSKFSIPLSNTERSSTLRVQSLVGLEEELRERREAWKIISSNTRFTSTNWPSCNNCQYSFACLHA